jgi:hypothetical protein
VTSLIVFDDINTETVQAGLHSFALRFRNTSKIWSNIVSTFFYKPITDALAGGAQFEYWIDNDFAGKVAVNNSTSTLILIDNLNLSSISNGLHVFNIRFKKQESHWSSATSTFFYKGLNTDSKLDRYQVWFDGVIKDTITTSTPKVNDLALDERVNTTHLLNGQHTYAFKFINTNGVSSAVVTGEFYKGDPDDRSICPGSSTTLYAGRSGSNYQWQADTGTGFINIAPNSVYGGSTTDTLRLTLPPTSFYGYKFRCIANGQPGTVYTLKFSSLWLGNTNTAWSNSANWACATIPDENTDVVINAGVSYYPVVNSNAICKKLIINPTADFKVSTGGTIQVKGKE